MKNSRRCLKLAAISLAFAAISYLGGKRIGAAKSANLDVRPFVMQTADFVVLDQSLEQITSRNIVSRRRDGAYSNMATLYGPAGPNEVTNTIRFPNGRKVWTFEAIRARSTTIEGADQLPDFMTATMVTNPPSSCVEQGDTLDGEEQMLAYQQLG